MEWLLLLLPAALVGHEMWRRSPPHLRYLSHRKRRASELALNEFAEESPDSRADWRGTWIFQTNHEKCVVLVQKHTPSIRPPSHFVYIVWHDTEQVDRLGCWTFHWGILPKHALLIYEKCRAEGRPWPYGLVEVLRAENDENHFESISPP